MLQKQKTIFLLSLWFSRIIQFWSYWRFVVNLMLSPMLSRFNHHSLTCTNIALASFPENQKQWKIRWSIHGNGEKGSKPFTHPLISAHHRKMGKVVLFPPSPIFTLQIVVAEASPALCWLVLTTTTPVAR